MKDCDQYLPDLCAWLDGELEDSSGLEAHLAGCASCRALAAQYRRIDAAMADVTPPANLHSHIMQGLNNAHSPKAKRRFAFGSATAVAATAAALLLVVGAGLIALPRWSRNSTAGTAADSAAVLSVNEDVANAAKSTYAVSPTGSADSSGVETSLTVSPSLADEPADTLYTEPEADESAPQAEEPAEEPAENTMEPELKAPSDAIDTNSGYEAPASGGDLTPYPEDSAADGYADASTQTDAMFYGGTLADFELEQIELRLAAGETLTWTVYDVLQEDLPDTIRSNTAFVRVGSDNIWIATLESTAVLEFYMGHGEELGGELTLSNNNTGSIVLDCR